jgi:hypothetical protein
MSIDERLLAPCGLYCGVCAIRISHRDKNLKFKEKLSTYYGVPPEQIECEGCRSDNVFVYCRVCEISACAGERQIQGCHLCGEFPCERIRNFPFETGRKVMLQAIPEWRESGTEEWVEAQINRYKCRACGEPLFRGATRCGKCKTPFETI